MGVIWDVIVVAILAVSAFIAYKKGLFETIFSLLGTAIALVGAWLLSTPVGAFISETFVFPTVRNTILSTIADSPVLKYEDAIANIDVVGKIAAMPEALQKLLTSVGIDTAEIAARAASMSSHAVDAKNQLIDSIATPISTTISTAIAFVALFVILLILCKVAAKLLGALCKLLPLGKKLNSLGGGVVGFLEGAVIVLVITAVFWTISGSVTEGFFSREAMQATLVTKEIVKVNPILDFFTSFIK